MRILRLLLVGALMLAAVAVGGAAPAGADHSHRLLFTIMTGEKEAPGPGDPDGIGIAGLFVDTTQDRICYILLVKNIEPATAAHIHKAPVGVPGSIVVPLDPPTSGFSADCVGVASALADDIAHSPDQYYVNVHNAPFPAGAIRGQLG
jgi:CHRD domain